MVPWSAKVKWKSGWRNILEPRDGAFVEYWARLLPSLPQELPAPASPGLLEAYGCSSPFVCAPMVLQSERAFRLMSKRHGVGVAFSPMIVASEIVNGGLEACPVALELANTHPEDRPVVAQLAGSDPECMIQAARMLIPFVDGIDVNYGCPQQCAAAGGYGAHFATAHPDRAVEVVKALAEAGLQKPVSVKMRLFEGTSSEDCDHSQTIAFAKRLEEAGANLITLHGRAISQRDHQRPADLDAIRAVKRAVRVPVLCNGNVRTLEDAQRCLAYTGCDGVMAAVGLLRDPRLFARQQQGPERADGADGEACGVLCPRTGVLADVCEALSCAHEYLQLAKAHPPPEPRSIRDHLKAILQGVLQWRHADVWDLLGNDRVACIHQMEQLLRLTASREGEHLLAGLGGWGHEGPRSLKQIKNELMLAEGGEGDTEEGMAGLFGWEDGEEEEEGS